MTRRLNTPLVNQRKVAAEIEQATAALGQRASEAGLSILAYLLECARLEAAQSARPEISTESD